MNVHTKWNCLGLFCLVWSNISCFKPENVSYNHSYLGCFQNALAFQNEKQNKTKKNQIMIVHTRWNYGTVWYPFVHFGQVISRMNNLALHGVWG